MAVLDAVGVRISSIDSLRQTFGHLEETPSVQRRKCSHRVIAGSSWRRPLLRRRDLGRPAWARRWRGPNQSALYGCRTL